MLLIIISTSFIAFMLSLYFLKYSFFNKSNDGMLEEKNSINNETQELSDEDSSRKIKSPICPFMSAFKAAKLKDKINQSENVDEDLIEESEKADKKLSETMASLMSALPKTDKRAIENVEKSSSSNESSDSDREDYKENLRKKLSSKWKNSYFLTDQENTGPVKNVLKRNLEELQNQLSPEEIEEEMNIQSKQLEEMHKIMKQQPEIFGGTSYDDIQNQMKTLYDN